ncbi:hypothetical protein [Scale drop disease virus]|uniref:Uncharacterized protein n=1 Tax=Scale drop disease virus TaxID=1697349 RepID=A0A7D5YIQ5_9VIRU|nr:hypothetical protein [Scale drop disease virus]QXJ13568.1 ORF115R [Scale drop disease virus]
MTIVEQLFADARVFMSNYKLNVTMPCFALLLNVPQQRLVITPDGLHAIIMSEDVEPKLLKGLLESNLADIDFSPSSLGEGFDPICHAAHIGNLDAMVTLANHTMYNIHNGKLAFASISSDEMAPAIMKFLMDTNVSFDIVDESGNPPLAYAIESDNLDTAKLLIDHNVGITPGNSEAHDMLMFAIVKAQNMALIHMIYNGTQFNLAKSIVISNQKKQSPLEYLINIPDQGVIDRVFVREFLDFTAPRYGFIGFLSPLPKWFEATRELFVRYQKYNTLAYKCIANSDRGEFKDMCSQFNLPYDN